MAGRTPDRVDWGHRVAIAILGLQAVVALTVAGYAVPQLSDLRSVAFLLGLLICATLLGYAVVLLIRGLRRGATFAVVGGSVAGLLDLLLFPDPVAMPMVDRIISMVIVAMVQGGILRLVNRPFVDVIEPPDTAPPHQPAADRRLEQPAADSETPSAAVSPSSGRDARLPLWWARQAGLEPLGPEPGDVLAVGDQEVGIAVVELDGRFVVERIDRNVRTARASFGSLASAYKFVLVDIGPYARAGLGLGEISIDLPELDAADGSGVIRVADGEFPGSSYNGRTDAARFALVADAKPGTIVASFRSRDGRPLFRADG